MNYTFSYWEKNYLVPKLDFIVLGAGLIGKQIAIKLKEKLPNASVAIIDKHPFSAGASTRNAGFACFGSVSEIIDDFNRSDANDVIKLAHKRFVGLQKLRQQWGTDSIGFIQNGSVEIFDKQDVSFYENTLQQVEHINNLLQKEFGINNIFKIQNNSLGFNAMDKLIFNAHEGKLNTGKLNAVMSDKMHRIGVLPYYGIQIDSIEQIGNGYSLTDSDGFNFTCTQLIMATNAFTPQLFPDIDIEPARGQIILTKPIPNLPEMPIIHADKGYIYARTIDDRILIGGGRNKFMEEERTTQFGNTHNLTKYLSEYLSNIILPNTPFEIDMQWSGIMAMGAEKLPIVRRINNNLLMCVRMSGMGVALGPVLSEEILEMI